MKTWLRIHSKPDKQNLTGFLWRFLKLRYSQREWLPPSQGYVSYIFRLFIIFALIIGLSSCGGNKAVSQTPSLDLGQKAQTSIKLSGKLAEAEPPATIQELNRSLDRYRPQVKILSPMDDEVLQTDSITVGLQVKDLPIFKDLKYGLGPHLSVILDNQPYTTVYDLQKPLTISNLTPGTHTLRVFAEKPWYESFKNDGAYAQAIFHVFTKTDENNPQSTLPLLTYNHPDGDYGAEPILLDFYLTNAPLQVSKNTNQAGGFSDWRIRCTINGDKFVIDRWQSVYLKGFQKGKNWIQLEFLDDQGEPIKNVFNTTTRTINYEPKGKDTLSRIVRGELTVEQVRGIVDVTYNPPAPVVEETPEPVIQETPKPEATPTPEPVIQETAKPAVTSTPEPIIKETAKPEVTPTPEPVIQETAKPEVTSTPEPVIQETPKPEIAPEPTTSGKLDNFFNRLQKPKSNITPNPSDVEPVESDRMEENGDDINDVINNDTPAIAPQPTPTLAPKPTKTDFGKYFQRPKPSVPTPTPADINRDISSPEDGEERSVSDTTTPIQEKTSTQTETQPELPVKTDDEKPKFSINDYLQKIKPKTPATVTESEQLPDTEEKTVEEVAPKSTTPANPEKIKAENQQPETKPATNLLEKIKGNRFMQKLQNPDNPDNNSEKNKPNYEVEDFIEITPESKPTPDVISP